MKSLYFVILLVAATFACKKDNTPDVLPQLVLEDKDWYILTAPDKKEILAAYGDIDSSLVITDGLKIYKTSDKGKTWQDAGYNSNIGLLGFAVTGDTLLALSSIISSTATGHDLFATQPYYFSRNKGSSWSPFTLFWKEDKVRIPLNRVKSGSGIEYLINRYELNGYVETAGIKTSTGNVISLPGKHQIKSLYFDKKSRLYVSASAALCGNGNEFAYCGAQNGILYVSKKSQP